MVGIKLLRLRYLHSGADLVEILLLIDLQLVVLLWFHTHDYLSLS